MIVCDVDHETLVRCEAAALRHNIDLLQRVEPDVTIPASKWTAHDVAAHLVSMIGRYLDADRRRADSAREVHVINREEIREFEGATMGELVGRLRSRTAKYNAFWPELPLDAMFPLRGGLPLDVACLRSNWISELMLHGRDVAVAVGEHCPLDKTSCLMSLRLLAHVLHTYVPAGVEDCALVIAPDGAGDFSIVVEGGVATSQAGAIESADQLAGPPDTLVLLLYGRIGLDEALAIGARITGDTARVRRVIERLEKP